MGIKLTAKHNWNDAHSSPFFEKTFRQNRITIGNHPAANVRLNGSVVSAEQLVIVDGMVEPIIINCAEGTWLNGESLGADERRSLRDGDVIHIGTYVINVAVLKKTDPEFEQHDLVPPEETRPQDHPDSLAKVALPFPDQPGPPLVAEDVGDPFLPKHSQGSEPVKTFAAILDGLRTDEDRFYFLIEGGRQGGTRVAIETDEMPIGLHATGDQLSFDVSSIASMFAVVRKDWSGVLLQPQINGLTINGELIDDVRRLRDGDRIAFPARERRMDQTGESILVFREPASLVILDSLMPRATPPENDPSQIVQSNGHIESGTVRSTHRFAAILRSNREYFGAFTFTELSLMAMGTIVGAVIIFLILNYS
jgi:pSer/pThr/pTyr-binding forkhead associated (FHA) protein